MVVEQLQLEGPDSSGLLDYRHLGVPATLVSTLVDAFFDHVYNARLLLHPKSFKDAVTGGKVRSDIFLGVCALGSM